MQKSRKLKQKAFKIKMVSCKVKAYYFLLLHVANFRGKQNDARKSIIQGTAFCLRFLIMSNVSGVSCVSYVSGVSYVSCLKCLICLRCPICLSCLRCLICVWCLRCLKCLRCFRCLICPRSLCLRDRITISQCFFNLNLLIWGGGG